ncbi:hypothetical protein MMC30_004461 [Trapelia coarctata]|nr:hypothetical protein [Trapelia coarctata]
MDPDPPLEQLEPQALTFRSTMTLGNTASPEKLESQALTFRPTMTLGNTASKDMSIEDVAGTMKELSPSQAYALATDAAAAITGTNDVLQRASHDIKNVLEEDDLLEKNRVNPAEADEHFETLNNLALKEKSKRGVNKEAKKAIDAKWGAEILERLEGLLKGSSRIWKAARKLSNIFLDYSEWCCRVLDQIYIRLTANRGQGVSSYYTFMAVDFTRAADAKNKEIKDCVTVE